MHTIELTLVTRDNAEYNIKQWDYYLVKIDL